MDGSELGLVSHGVREVTGFDDVAGATAVISADSGRAAVRPGAPHKRIALVNYPPAQFQEFRRALEDRGWKVFWITNDGADARVLTRRFGVPDRRVLDPLTGFEPRVHEAHDCAGVLAQLECRDGPRVYDVILMDRILRKAAHDVACAYLHHVAEHASRFLRDNEISLVSSGRDTATQLVIMLACRRLAVPWVVPTRVRVPPEMYGFCAGHETAAMIRLRDPEAADYDWARQFFDAYRHAPITPRLRNAARTFGDVARLLPHHARAFAGALRAPRWRRTNRLTRYTASQLVRMYIRRRVNLALYRLRRPHAPPAEKPFCLYALHTQPESSIDVSGAYFSDQQALVTFIARSLPATHELYVKVHPTDVDGKSPAYYRRLAAVPGVRIIGYDVPVRDLISRASIVFTLTGTIGYEAALMGKPVVTFANNFFNGLPTVHYCDSPPRLPSLVDRLLTASAPVDLEAHTVEFLADVSARCVHGEFNRMYDLRHPELTRSDLAALQDAYDRIYQLLCAGADPTAARSTQFDESV